MKATVLCLLLLAIVTLVSSEGGKISVFNNGTYPSKVYIDYVLEDGSKKNFTSDRSPLTAPKETETAVFPEGFEYSHFAINAMSPEYIPHKTLFWGDYISQPIDLCFKTWGTAEDPQIGQTDCRSTGAQALLSGDGAAISVTNNATYRSEINLSYALKNDQGTRKKHEESSRYINPGETQTVPIPKGAEDVNFDIAHPTMDTVSLFQAAFPRPVKLCFKIWGTSDDPKIGQIDC